MGMEGWGAPELRKLRFWVWVWVSKGGSEIYRVGWGIDGIGKGTPCKAREGGIV